MSSEPRVDTAPTCEPDEAKSSPSTLLPTRRDLLRSGLLTGLGLGGIALDYLGAADAPRNARAADSVGSSAEAFGMEPKSPHFQPQAKAVILMMQNGGPSQMDLFDPKPELTRYNGKQHSIKVEMFQAGSEENRLLGSPFRFQRYGKCGMQLADVIPHIGSVADDLCLVRSMHTGHNNHTEGLVMFMTGKIFQGRPTFGSWITYALGTENQSLPAYVVLRDPKGYNTSGTLTWTSGWLPALFRGTEFSSEGSPILNLRPARQQLPEEQRRNLDFLASLNRLHQRRFPLESDLETRIQNYELAARMQLEAARVLDLSNETEEVRRLYGLDDAKTRSYGLRCLMARKLVELGVRFVQVHPKPFQPWDTHNKTRSGLDDICGETDLPAAGLVRDLKERGLLDSTIVLWSGEFGRLPVSQNGTGRDHNRNAFSLWVAGGGFRRGHIHGATDEVGYRAAVDRVSVADLHATILHQLGINHETLTYEHSGREETLTDPSLTHAAVAKGLLDKGAS